MNELGAKGCKRIVLVALAATTLFAAAASMAQEALLLIHQCFLQTLSKAKRFEITHGGRIMAVYGGSGEQILRFSRIVDK